MQTTYLRRLLPLAWFLAVAAEAQVLPNWVTPPIPGVVAGGLKIEPITTGLEGSEGPLGLPDGSLLFTETRAQRILRIAPDDSVSVFLEQSNGANGLALTPEGDLVAVQVAEPRVGIVHPVERRKVLAEGHDGRAFARPNDLVRAGNGDLFFTDSGQNPDAGQTETAGPAVYRLSAAGELQRLADDIARPNGIQLSKDERTLFVANTLGQHVLAFALDGNGRAGARREFAPLAGWNPTEGSSGADGLAVDDAGRLYVTSNAGIEVFSETGEALGVIPFPVKPQNLAFAGPGKTTLYVVGRGGAYRFPVLTPGLLSRPK